MVLPAFVALLLLFASGLLLSRIRFCMVGTVRLALRGEWADTQATLIICSMITAVLLLAGLAEHRPLEQYGAPLRVLAGGLLFGVTAAWNKGCFVGTSIQLMAGDLRGLISVVGWVLGFRLLGSPMALPVLPSSDGRALITLAVLVLPLLLLLWRNRLRPSTGPDQQQVDWRSSILCGVMLGVLDNDLWKWDPSAVARALSQPMALVQAWQQGQGHVVFGLMLLVGMFADALIQRRWRWVAPDWRDLPRLGYGMAMAMGAVLAMGGNDSQLLRYLPNGSPQGWLAVPAMVGGIIAGFRIAEALNLKQR